jgi:hypothetical protein
MPETPINGPRSLNDIFNAANSTSETTDLVSDETTEKTIDDCINETAANCRSSQRASLVERINPSNDNELSATMSNELVQLKEEKEKLQTTLDRERKKVQSLLDSEGKKTAKHEEELSELMEKIDLLQREKETNKKKEAKLREAANTIKSIEYDNIQTEIIHEFFTPKYSLILNYLRDKVQIVDPSFADRIPKMIFNKNNDQYIVTIVGFQGHHDEFKAILQRIWSLLNLIQSAKDFYQRHLNRTMRSMIKDILSQVKSRSQIWREYKQIFIQLLQEKTLEYKKRFDDYLQEKLKLLIDKCILAKLSKPWIQIRTDTDNFLKNSSLMNEVELIKQKALDEFIKQNISTQRLKLDTEPTLKSASVLQNFIQKIQTEFRTNKKYQGHEIKHFNFIPKLLERLMLYYSCFKIQLPLYESSEELLDKIEKNAVTTISTSTGSGNAESIFD